MRNFKVISVDKFIEDALYNKKTGYYFSQNPFGKGGDFITSPGISFLFSEMIAIWIIYFWEMLGKPKNFSFVELGPGNGSLCKTILNTFEKFPHFNKSTKVYLYEKSEKLIKVQKKLLRGRKVTWIQDFDTLKNYPVFFLEMNFLMLFRLSNLKRRKIKFMKNILNSKTKFFSKLFIKRFRLIH